MLPRGSYNANDPGHNYTNNADASVESATVMTAEYEYTHHARHSREQYHQYDATKTSLEPVNEPNNSSLSSSPFPQREPLKIFLRIRPTSSPNSGHGNRNAQTSHQTATYHSSHGSGFFSVENSLPSTNECDCMTVLQDNETVVMTPPQVSNAYKSRTPAQQFSFSHVFQPDTSQRAFFDATALPLVADFLQGQNSLLFAYGITNSGKTFSIQGSPEEPGVLPRLLDVIFKSIHGLHTRSLLRPVRCNQLEMPSPAEVTDNWSSLLFAASPGIVPIIDDSIQVAVDRSAEYCVWASYCEIYNEHAYDLLVTPPNVRDLQNGVKRRKLALKSSDKGAYVSGLKQVRIHSLEEGHRVLLEGQRNRQVFSTLLNTTSSRSHAIFTISLVKFPRDARGHVIEDPGETCINRFSIVDLAGSERVKHTLNTGERLREAQCINKSLMTLHRCMELLRAHQLSPESKVQLMIPFRDSKLTELFQSFFVGDGKAIMIVNANPSPAHYDETLHVMRFSSIAKDITTLKHVAARIDTGLLTGSKTALREDMLDDILEDEGYQQDLSSDGDIDDEDESQREEIFRLRRHIQMLQRQIEAGANMEAELREEMSNALSSQIQQMEQMFQERLEDETDRHCKIFEKKMDLLGQDGTHDMTRREIDTRYDPRTFQQQIMELNAQIAASKDRITQLEAMLQVKECENVHLKHKMSLSSQEIQEISKESEESLEEVRFQLASQMRDVERTSEKEIRELQGMVDKLKDQNNHLAKKAESNEKSAIKWKNQCQELEETNASLMTTLSEISAAATSASMAKLKQLIAASVSAASSFFTARRQNETGPVTLQHLPPDVDQEDIAHPLCEKGGGSIRKAAPATKDFLETSLFNTASVRPKLKVQTYEAVQVDVDGDKKTTTFLTVRERRLVDIPCIEREQGPVQPTESGGISVTFTEMDTVTSHRRSTRRSSTKHKTGKGRKSSGPNSGSRYQQSPSFSDMPAGDEDEDSDAKSFVTVESDDEYHKDQEKGRQIESKALSGSNRKSRSIASQNAHVMKSILSSKSASESSSRLIIPDENSPPVGSRTRMRSRPPAADKGRYDDGMIPVFAGLTLPSSSFDGDVNNVGRGISGRVETAVKPKRKKLRPKKANFDSGLGDSPVAVRHPRKQR